MEARPYEALERLMGDAEDGGLGRAGSPGGDAAYRARRGHLALVHGNTDGGTGFGAAGSADGSGGSDGDATQGRDRAQGRGAGGMLDGAGGMLDGARGAAAVADFVPGGIVMPRLSHLWRSLVRLMRGPEPLEPSHYDARTDP